MYGIVNAKVLFGFSQKKTLSNQSERNAPLAGQMIVTATRSVELARRGSPRKGLGLEGVWFRLCTRRLRVKSCGRCVRCVSTVGDIYNWKLSGLCEGS